MKQCCKEVIREAIMRRAIDNLTVVMISLTKTVKTITFSFKYFFSHISQKQK